MESLADGFLVARLPAATDHLTTLIAAESKSSVANALLTGTEIVP